MPSTVPIEGRLLSNYGPRFSTDQGEQSNPVQPPGQLPASLPHGFAARSLSAAQSGVFGNVLGCIVLSEIPWSAWQPTDTNHLDSGAVAQLHTALDWLDSHTNTEGQPYQGILRIDHGYNAPGWLKTQTNAVPWATTRGVGTGWTPVGDGGGGSFLPGGVPPWWHNGDGFWDACHNLDALLASEYGGHPRLSVVTMAWPTTQFDEPNVHQYGYVLNRTTGGTHTPPWTITAEDAAFAAGWQSHDETWGQWLVACETSYNPADQITPKGDGTFKYGTDYTRTIRLMEAQVAALGGLALVANHSYENTKQSANYVPIYNRMKGFSQQTPPIGSDFQTEIASKMQADGATLLDTANLAIGSGAIWLELPQPVGPLAQITVAQAAILNPQFGANMAPLVIPTSGGGTGTGSGGGTGGSGTGTGTPDNPVMDVDRALYLIAGAVYGDPAGNAGSANEGTFTLSHTNPGFLKRAAKMADTVQQFHDAFTVLGGTATLTNPDGPGEASCSGTLPAGYAIKVDLTGAITITTPSHAAADAFGLTQVGGVWNTTCDGGQTRAFLTGFMQGEGNVGGHVGDDPLPSHLTLIQKLMASPGGNSVATDLTTSPGGRGTLTVHAKADFPFVQLYPFTPEGYTRCPGGKP